MINLVPLTEHSISHVYADLGLQQLIPISLLGAGFFNVLFLAANLNAMTDGVVLIDEIEDGLHYSIRPKIVDMIFTFARSHNIQFFVTSHSAEFIREFGSQSSNFDDVSISAYRLNKQGFSVKPTYFSRDEFEAAIELDTEIR